MKRLLLLILAGVMALGVGCKDTATQSSASTDIPSAESQIVETEVDDTQDPENIDLGEAQGGKVSAGELIPQSEQAFGIDVSKWQGKIDWKAVKSDGIDFAIIRIGYRGENGKIYRDSNADYNIQQATKNGLLVGVYFFSTAINTAEAREEPAFVVNAVRGYKISYPIVYDCEGFLESASRMYSLDSAARTQNALAFLGDIKASGYDGMLYAAKSDLEGGLWDISQISSSYKIWVAHYPSVTYPQIKTPAYSGKYDMWQYTNCGTVKGVEGNCDMIVSYFSASEKGAVDKNAAPPTAQAPKTQEELVYTDANDSVTAKEEVNLREGPSTKYGVVGTLKSGEFLTRTGIGTNGWSRLTYNGKTVYAITSYLSNEVIEIDKPDTVAGQTFTPKSDRVTAKIEVNLRAEPTTSAAVVGVLKAGDFLDRTAMSGGGWSRLILGGQTVYAVTSYLTDTVPETNTEQSDNITEHGMEFTPVSVNVTAKEEVNLRDKPTTDGSNVVYTLKNGEYAQKVGESKSGWSRIIWNGQTVYAITSFLTQ
ncbi:MAG: SH3 domain-containing protein [Clostridia bacterium]|nr:SH3 domain-containing protein [Clostridia bacterium]